MLTLGSYFMYYGDMLFSICINISKGFSSSDILKLDELKRKTICLTAARYIFPFYIEIFRLFFLQFFNFLFSSDQIWHHSADSIFIAMVSAAWKYSFIGGYCFRSLLTTSTSDKHLVWLGRRSLCCLTNTFWRILWIIIISLHPLTKTWCFCKLSKSYIWVKVFFNCKPIFTYMILKFIPKF